MTNMNFDISPSELAQGDFVELAVTEVSSRASNRGFTVKGYVACQPHRARMSDRKLYVVSVLQINLREYRIGCELISGTEYEDVSQKGKTTVVTSSSAAIKESQSFQGHAGAAVSNRGGKVKVSADLESKSDTEQQSQLSTKTYTELARVRRVAGGWRIGLIDGGDPIRGNVLDGMYMADSSWAEYKFRDQAGSAELTYSVSVPVDMFQFDRIDTDWIDDGSTWKDLLKSVRKPNKKESLKKFIGDLTFRKMIAENMASHLSDVSEVNLGNCTIKAQVDL